MRTSTREGSRSRHAPALEIEPRFVDLAIRRWRALTGPDAHDAASGLSFDAIATGRMAVDGARGKK